MAEGYVMKVLVVDDHPLFREGLKSILGKFDQPMLVFESTTYADAQALIQSEPGLDLVLLDLNLPDVDGLTALEDLRRVQPQLPVVIISASENREDVLAAMRHGAPGFISKASSSATLEQALRLVLSGGVYLPPHIMLEDVPSGAKVLPSPVLSSPGYEDALARLGLTERQMQVLLLMARGESNKSIARALNVAENTVKVHMTAILRALEVSSRAQAIAALARMGVRP